MTARAILSDFFGLYNSLKRKINLAFYVGGRRCRRRWARCTIVSPASEPALEARRRAISFLGARAQQGILS